VRYSDLLVENREFLIPYLYLAPPQGVTHPVGFFDAGKTRMIGLPYGEKTVTIKSVKPFSSDTAALRTDRRTEYRASVC